MFFIESATVSSSDWVDGPESLARAAVVLDVTRGVAAGTKLSVAAWRQFYIT